MREINFVSVVPDINENDAFFLDTNVIIAYSDEGNIWHDPVYYFLNYLMSKNVVFCVSETVVQEVIFILSRLFYAKDKFEEDASNSTLSPEAKREKIERISYQFMKETKPKADATEAEIQAAKEILSRYTKIAWETFQEFYEDWCVYSYNLLIKFS